MWKRFPETRRFWDVHAVQPVKWKPDLPDKVWCLSEPAHNLGDARVRCLVDTSLVRLRWHLVHLQCKRALPR